MRLSGGDNGGDEVIWKKDGIVEDGREYMIVSDNTYVKVSDDEAALYQRGVVWLDN